MAKEDLQQYSKAELIYFIQHYALRSIHTVKEVILEKRIKDNHNKVDKLLEESHNENQRITEITRVYGDKITDDNIDEVITIHKRLDIINKKIDKCWAENEKYSKILYGDDKND